MSHWFRRIIDNVLSRAAPAVENSHSANSEVRMSWSRHITCDVLARAGTPTLPHGPHHVPCPTSASDFAETRPLPAARGARPMFVPIAQRSPSDIEP
jgi:hypothetical protein